MATTDSLDHHKQLHVAMFPWLAFGHIIPFLELSKFIAEKGHKVSFLSTTRNIQHWIIYDFAPYWLPSIAAGLGISRAVFFIVNAWFVAFAGSSPDNLMNSSDGRTTAEDFLTPPKWVPFPSKLCYRIHEANWMMDSLSVNASGVSDLYRSGMVLKGSECMFIRHCYEFESQWLTLLEKLHQLPVVPVGLMPPETPTNVGVERDDTWMTVKAWLNGQQKGCVVYVALGSEVMVSKREVAELALGLELSGLPFFWALRKPTGSTESNSVELPDGFLERNRDRGVVPRNEEDGSFTKESVAGSLRSVVVDDEGRIYKANAKGLSQIFGDTKLEERYINQFIDYLEKKRRVVSINNET
ncbi:hypothetical protein M8C21_017223 [Ambrosia artemisiifolia]|uniref:Uncharacterized protein n=1 Tax=Ambrosia artemisiifolia TaxID=4212 RepID=A0AAD5GJP4_AMBAR|nr:hypothetical protein M8C21_017223 [Ambrosia artemisiifolia]